MKRALLLNAQDNVATLLETVVEGELVEIRDNKGDLILEMRAATLIAQGHKIALWNMEKGTEIMKYGFPIGYATKQIPAGAFVHTHNLESARGRGDKSDA